MLLCCLKDDPRETNEGGVRLYQRFGTVHSCYYHSLLLASQCSGLSVMAVLLTLCSDVSVAHKAHAMLGRLRHPKLHRVLTGQGLVRTAGVGEQVIVEGGAKVDFHCLPGGHVHTLCDADLAS